MLHSMLFCLEARHNCLGLVLSVLTSTVIIGSARCRGAHGCRCGVFVIDRVVPCGAWLLARWFPGLFTGVVFFYCLYVAVGGGWYG